MSCSAFGVDHGTIRKKLNESTKRGAEAGAVLGGGLGATQGGVEVANRAKALHSEARAAGVPKRLANAAMGGHVLGRGIRGAAVGGAALGTVGYLARPRKKGPVTKAWNDKPQKKQNVGALAAAGATGGVLGHAAIGAQEGQKTAKRVVNAYRRRGAVISKPKAAVTRAAGAGMGGLEAVKTRPGMALALGAAGAAGGAIGAKHMNRKNGYTS